jgi:hypothetical protein
MTKTVDRAVIGGRAAFFEDPESDRLLSMLMRLVTEHWALKERVMTLEAVLAEHKIIPTNALESYLPDADEDARWSQESFDMIRSLIEAAQNIENRHRGPTD